MEILIMTIGFRLRMTACDVVVRYWGDVVPAEGIIAIVIVLYAYEIKHCLGFEIKWRVTDAFCRNMLGKGFDYVFGA